MKLFVGGVVVILGILSTLRTVESTCGDGWTLYDESCYRYFSVPDINWVDAQLQCEDEGGNLTAIHSAEDQSFLTDFWVTSRGDVSDIDFPTVLIGLIDTTTEDRGETGNYYWIDDTPLDYINWSVNQPSLNHENVAVMWDRPNKLGQWNDISKTAKVGSFICQLSIEGDEKEKLGSGTNPGPKPNTKPHKQKKRGWGNRKGHKGHRGHKGYKGHNGHKGHEGHKGYKGYEGHEGHRGYKGHGGHKGHKGYKGYEGHKGHRGYKGHGGHKGHKG